MPDTYKITILQLKAFDSSILLCPSDLLDLLKRQNAGGTTLIAVHLLPTDYQDLLPSITLGKKKLTSGDLLKEWALVDLLTKRTPKH